jgi:hypothetical protein
MSKPVPRRLDAIQHHKPAAAATLPASREAAVAEPPPPPAPLSWGWRLVFTLWASAFGFMLVYEAFKMIRSIVH